MIYPVILDKSALRKTGSYTEKRFLEPKSRSGFARSEKWGVIYRCVIFWTAYSRHKHLSPTRVSNESEPKQTEFEGHNLPFETKQQNLRATNSARNCASDGQTSLHEVEENDLRMQTETPQIHTKYEKQ